MSNSWQEAYSALIDFIAEHPEIKIEATRVRLPKDIRTEFYRLFNVIRATFVEEKFPSLLNEARALGESYTKVEAEVSKLLGLDDVSITVDFHRFVNNPTNELIRGLFNPLFQLLKGKLGIEAFEDNASRNIVARFRGLYRLGYEKWVVLSLVKLIQADMLFQVIPRPFVSDQEETVMSATFPEEEPPPLAESKSLSFKRDLTTTFTVPDFIVHSSRINRYVAVRSQIGEAFATVSKASDNREWYPFGPIKAFVFGLTLVYVANNQNEISLVADAKQICRPDLVIECRWEKDWNEEMMKKVKLEHDVLKPILGTYIVSREPVPEQDYMELMPEESVEPTSGKEQLEQETARQAGIQTLAVGFDQSRLEPIINALTSKWSSNES